MDDTKSNLPQINTEHFYSHYHGHSLKDLCLLYTGLRIFNSDNEFVYLAGDSSFDNKYWLRPGSLPTTSVSNRSSSNYPLRISADESLSVTAINDYQYILDDPYMKPDISYHLNSLFSAVNKCAINCAVEESTLGMRANKLLPQDKFIRDTITEKDTLIISVGGNDIALQPTKKTMWNMLLLMKFNSKNMINKGPNSAWGMSYFVKMFKDDVEEYIKKLTIKTKPKKVIVCMIYYLDEKMTGSWADTVLGYLGYNNDPSKLQLAINQIYEHATKEIQVDDLTIIPFPFFKVLDGKNTDDYVQRVEPSNSGGRKIAYELSKFC